MSTTQILCKTGMRQPEPQRSLVEEIPVKERRKLSVNEEILKSFQGCTWEDLRGLSIMLEEE